MSFNIQKSQWRSLMSYNTYRLFSLLLMVGLWFSNYEAYGNFPLLWITTVYGMFSGLAFLLLYFKRPKFSTQVLVFGIIDIVALSLYVTFLYKLQVGLGVLINVNVAILSLLVPGRLAIFFAAIASSMLLVICSVEYLFQNFNNTSVFFYSGIHGVGLFATAIVAWFLAKRLHSTELLARKRGSQLADMQKINQYIVEKLRAGVLYVNQYGAIEVINSVAIDIFNCQNEPKPIFLHELSPQLGLSFSNYVEDSGKNKVSSTVILKSLSLRVQYIPATQSHSDNYLLILENMDYITQQAQQLKLASLGRFSASIAHELRNPLGAISHAVQLMGNNGLDSEDMRLKCLIEKHCNRMNEIVKNTLQLSRREKAKPIRLDIIQFLREFIDDYQLCHNCQFNLEIDSPQPISVCFDQNQLEQILIILCDNAIKHNRDTINCICITFKVIGDKDKITLKVIDNGKGINEDCQKNLFEPFFSTETDGLGMGLFIAKELVEINNTQLRYDNSIIDGCCFNMAFGDKDIEYYE